MDVTAPVCKGDEVSCSACDCRNPHACDFPDGLTERAKVNLHFHPECRRCTMAMIALSRRDPDEEIIVRGHPSFGRLAHTGGILTAGEIGHLLWENMKLEGAPRG